MFLSIYSRKIENASEKIIYQFIWSIYIIIEQHTAAAAAVSAAAPRPSRSAARRASCCCRCMLFYDLKYIYIYIYIYIYTYIYIIQLYMQLLPFFESMSVSKKVSYLLRKSYYLYDTFKEDCLFVSEIWNLRSKIRFVQRKVTICFKRWCRMISGTPDLGK